MGRLKLGKFSLRTPAVCAALTAANLNGMKSALLRARGQGADVAELRFDGLGERRGWERLIPRDMPIIFTNRPKREGGGFGGSEKNRVDIILGAIGRGISCVDIELSTPEGLRNLVVSEAKRSGVSVIMSHHDFSSTPEVGALVGLAKRMAQTKCDLAKIITFAAGPEEALRVLNFLIKVKDEVGLPVISFAMGDAGKMTRIMAPLLGSPLTYANVGRPTAPGQLGVGETKQMLHKLLPKGTG